MAFFLPLTQLSEQTPYTRAKVNLHACRREIQGVNAAARAADGLTWKHLQSTGMFLGLHWRIYKIHGCN
jgi:hypothetical protein